MFIEKYQRNRIDSGTLFYIILNCGKNDNSMAVVTFIVVQPSIFLYGNKLPACQGCGQALLVSSSVSDTEGLWRVNKDMHPLLLASHLSCLDVHSNAHRS